MTKKRRKSEKKEAVRRENQKLTYRKVKLKKATAKKPKGFFINGYFVLLVVILILAVVYFAFNFDSFFRKSVEEVPTCGDGSFYDTCSLRKPYLCEGGILVEAARFCGCPPGFNKDGDICINSFYSVKKEINLPYLLNGEPGEIEFDVYKGLYGYLGNLTRSISYEGEERLFRVDFTFRKINEENQRQMLDALVVGIQNVAKNKDDQARIAVSIVQNIEFGESDKRTLVTENVSVGYARYPYEVLYDGQGVCGEKSELLVSLLRELDFGVVLFYNQKENHESVGIKCPVEESYWNSGYCFVETSGPSIITDEGIEYGGGVKLTSKPEIMFISDGVSLSNSLREYGDAEKFMKIREKVEQGKNLNSGEKKKLDELNSYYGLVEIYNS